jgi:hypothetical protein
MTATVNSLQPGDVVQIGPERALFVAETEHPIWQQLRLVVWRLTDGSWSHDALDARQVVGQVERSSRNTRDQRLRAALTHTGHAWTEVPA